ncbi:MAG: hypothetical protein PV344_09225 [Anaplasma sp.]|nr:hypothetical protein [Anaplasma sp.]
MCVCVCVCVWVCVCVFVCACVRVRAHFRVLSQNEFSLEGFFVEVKEIANSV